jgi:transposase-like protein
MKNVVRKIKKINRKKIKYITPEDAINNKFLLPDGSSIDSERMLLNLLLPSAVKEFYNKLEAEVNLLCGPKGKHTDDENSRWSQQKGSVYLGGQKIGLQYQRVINSKTKKDIPIETYKTFQDKSLFDQNVFSEGLRKVSQRDYKKGLPQIAGSFGFSNGAVSRSWMRSSKTKLEELMNRDINSLNIVSVFIDGKRYHKSGVVLALGVSVNGCKYVLGIYESDTENTTACLGLLNDMEKRGLPTKGILFIVDGGSGLNKALESKYSVDDPKKREAIRLRCYQHKVRNIEDHLKKSDKSAIKATVLFNSVRLAKDATEADAFSVSLESHLGKLNRSALKSFREAKDDLLMLHELGLSKNLKRFFSTTNPIESLNSITEEDMRRVKRWRNSEHFQRWCATMSLMAEKRMRRIRGFKGLEVLQKTLIKLCSGNITEFEKKRIDNLLKLAA